MNLYQPTITGSLSVSGSVNISGSISIAGGGTISGTASIATTALTASSADNFLTRGTLTAQTLVVQTITSSVDFVTGSTRFGSIAANTHTFTGSMLVTGSIVASGSTSTTALTINSGGNSGVPITLLNNGLGTQAFVFDDNTNIIVGPSAFATRLASNTYSIVASGSLGVGVSSPEARFHIKSGEAGSISLQSNTIAVFENGSHTRVNIQSPDTYSPQIYFSSPSYPNNAAISSYLAAPGTANLTFEISGSAIMTIKSGSVGIFQPNAAAPLHIVKDGGTTGYSATTYANSAIVIARTTGGGEQMGFRLTNASQVGISGTAYAGQILSDGNNIFEIYTTAGSPLVLGTTATERMRIDGSGNIGIGSTGALQGAGLAKVNVKQTSATIPALSIAVENASATHDGTILIGCQRTASSAYNLLSAYAGNGSTDDFSVAQFRVRGDGVIFAQNTTVQSITSDRELKTDIIDYNHGLSEILAMKPRYFKYKDNLEVQKAGFIAQEMDEALPGSMVDSQQEGYKTYEIDWYPILVKAIQELKAEFDAYKATHP